MFDQMEEKARRKLIESSALKRPAEPVEVANVALFLASDLSSFITGQNIRIDGGMWQVIPKMKSRVVVEYILRIMFQLMLLQKLKELNAVLKWSAAFFEYLGLYNIRS